LLRDWRIRFRVVGVEVLIAGTKDENLIPILHQLATPTLFSLDQDFFHKRLAHRNYALVWLDVADDRAAEFIRRFLRHPAFDTQAKRMGVVARVHADGVTSWRLPGRSAQVFSWPTA